MRLEIGGGRFVPPEVVNLDPVHGEGVYRRRAQDGPFPFPDDSVDEVRCSHVLEHIPAGADRIHVFNETWRVLRPGGTWEIIVPVDGWGVYADPTHISRWCEQSFWYFTGRIVPEADYGLRMWELVEWSERDCEWGTEGRALLRKPA